MTRTTRILTVAGAVTALAAPLAYGHAEIKRYSPAKGSTVPRTLSVVSVRFSEGVLGGSLVVKDANGRKFSRSSALADHKRVLRARLKSLHKGRYTAKATWLADDGDKQSKSWSFKVR